MLPDAPRWKGARSGVDGSAPSSGRSPPTVLSSAGSSSTGHGSHRMLLSEAIRGGEALAWVKPVWPALGAHSKATTP